MPLNDTFGLLARLGADCAGALRVLEPGAHRVAEPADVRWLDDEALADMLDDLPARPLGIPRDGRVRLSLAGVQSKAVLVRGDDGRFGEPLGGTASTHLLKPEPADAKHPGIAAVEHFCMRLASRCGLRAAPVEPVTAPSRAATAWKRGGWRRSTS